ncbi:M48 family metallopeptidase [uncultured Tenacibaculum sp.]|uniref:M48 family metallopeptidase n=1 Tax=uncultured Tenacibaculum sp. TaxID=174713 RepID=UPI0026369091|nr:M48 family metallopeptidase [uncultured Tenacibaculum sp.]
MAFKATFYDGESSASYDVNIHPYSNNWRISFTDQTDKEVNWKIDLIKKSDVFTKDLVAFTYGESFPFQRIESSDSSFINYINSREEFSNSLDVVLHKSKNISILFLLSSIVGISLLMYFFVLPSLAVSFAKNLDKENVIQFGNYVYESLEETLDIDKGLSEKLQDFVDILTINSEFPITVEVANDNQLNAFAISGGKVVIYSGLLEKIENEHQLTALIGHEVSHIENRHIIKNLARNISGNLFISIVFGDINSATNILSENAHLFSQLSFSRSLEKEADLYGLDVMKENNLDLHGMPDLFVILKEETSSYAPEYLSSHPMLDDRIEYTKEIAEKENRLSNNSILKEKWNIIKLRLKASL